MLIQAGYMTVPHSCSLIAPAYLQQVLCFKTQTPEPGFSGGAAAEFLVGYFSSMERGPLEKLEHLKPYPHLKNTVRIFLLLGLQGRKEG